MHTRTIKLSNGSLTLSGDFNLFTLSKDERYWFGCIVDSLGSLEKSSAQARCEIRSMNDAVKTAQAPSNEFFDEMTPFELHPPPELGCVTPNFNYPFENHSFEQVPDQDVITLDSINTFDVAGGA